MSAKNPHADVQRLIRDGYRDRLVAEGVAPDDADRIADAFLEVAIALADQLPAGSEVAS